MAAYTSSASSTMFTPAIPMQLRSHFVVPSPTAAAFELRGAVPQTPVEAAELLRRAEELLPRAGVTGVVERLVRFLGANSRAWTTDNRARLRRILGTTPLVVEAIVEMLSSFPRTDTLDDAETVLRSLVDETSRELIKTHFQRSDLDVEIRVRLLRALATQGMLDQVLVQSAIDDPNATLRAAAYAVVPDLPLGDKRALLTRGLSKETSDDVKQTIRQALEELEP